MHGAHARPDARSHGDSPAHGTAPSEDQAMELEALQSIYFEEFEGVPRRHAQGGACS